MQQPPRVLCIMDLACVGRAGAATAVAALSACGVQCCALPTELYGTHLGGFGETPRHEADAFAQNALAQYQREGVEFGAVYTGYLTTPAHFALANAAFALWPAALKLTDPVLADGGRLYARTTAQTVAAMEKLAAQADIITPNLTEAALLAGLAPDAAPDAAAMARQLATGRSVVVTGGSGPYIALCGPGRQPECIPYAEVPQSYPGTGDLFAACLLGLLLRGHGLRAATAGACGFVGAAVKATFEAGGEVRQGVWFEPLLGTLAIQAGEAGL